MIYIIMLVVFVLGYVAIALEHPIKVDKAASALIIGTLGWALFAFSGMEAHHISEELKHHLVDIAEILFFLLGAMTIVELIDVHEGFTVITDKIATRHRVKLMWILCIITFFFSAVLDNLTTSIVMAALISKLIKDKNDLWMFAGMIIISANAGGAWSPIGDVTTIMLWIGGQVTAASIIKAIIIPSIVCLIVPLTYISFKMKGELAPLSIEENKGNTFKVPSSERNLVFILGVAGLLFVPVFKTVTHLPPYLGILFSLGVLWLVTELLHAKKSSEIKSKLSVIAVIKKVDVATIFFFMGILLAVASLQSMGHLKDLALILNDTFNGNIYAINIIIGLLSSILDNVPLVAGAMGMYEVSEVGLFAVDGKFWQFLAYCAGTGGSVLIIGSAAGVAVMGILKVDFIWYVKKISILALMGYLAGAATYILMQ
ncbi:MAG: sodium:proton antiporter NhaD [Flavobacteriales bacterium]